MRGLMTSTFMDLLTEGGIDHAIFRGVIAGPPELVGFL